MISLGIIGIYNSHRLWKLKKGRLPNAIHDWTLLNKRSIYVLAIIPTVMSMLLYFWLFSGDLLQNLLTVLCALVSVFYVKRIGKFALRDIPYLKVIFVLIIEITTISWMIFTDFCTPTTWGMVLISSWSKYTSLISEGINMISKNRKFRIQGWS